MIKIRLVAFSDAAGKFDPNAPLNGNEDNFYIDDDFNDDVSYRAKLDSPVDLSPLGCLMVVADGMGGMNAGEVASAIAVDTVKDYFSAGKITPAIAADHMSRSRYMQQVIVEADRRIKTQANTNADQQGMGSTMIMAWIVGSQMSLVWIGDSRAYRFNPAGGLQLVSRDHSYVQELVNNGVITYEDTFEHPQGNIVTRSLGDPSHNALPESKLVELFTGDIVMLCSDGLSGVVRDVKTADESGAVIPGDTIEDIIRANTDSMTRCREQLMAAAERNHWYDNVTVLLCQILEGAPVYAPAVAARATSISYRRLVPPATVSPAVAAPVRTERTAVSKPSPGVSPAPRIVPQTHSAATPGQESPAHMGKRAKRSNAVFFIMAFIVVVVLALVWYFFLKGEQTKTRQDDALQTEQVNESVEIPERTLPSGSGSETTESGSRHQQPSEGHSRPSGKDNRQQEATPAPGKKKLSGQDAVDNYNRLAPTGGKKPNSQNGGDSESAKPKPSKEGNNMNNKNPGQNRPEQQADELRGRNGGSI